MNTQIEDALALIWKNPGKGSQDALGEFKRSWGYQKDLRKGIGHTGTLDPFAEGLLLVGMGEGTKLLAALQNLDKCYTAEFVWGLSTDTLDSQGNFLKSENLESAEILGRWQLLERSALEEKMALFLKSKEGAFDQVPPQHSAVHIDGKRAYEWAREGINKNLKSRRSFLHSARILSLRWEKKEEIDCLICAVELKVSSGTYIRALARDWGLELFYYPGYLESLVRTGIGPYRSEKPTNCNGLCGFLQVNDLSPLFKFITLEAENVQRLQKTGQWPALIRGDEDCRVLLLNTMNEPVAWRMEQKAENLGRIFQKNPFIKIGFERIFEIE